MAGMKHRLEEGLICQLLHSPDYNLFPKSAVFESNFVQVTKKGKWVDITNLPTIVTMGVTSSDPCLPLPNVLLMARHRTLARDLLFEDNGRSSVASSIDLTRLLPLRYVRLSIHSVAQHILCLQMVTKKVYYLQLNQHHPNAVFALWVRLANILQKGLSITTKDPNIRIRHSMVPSGSSPSSSSSADHGMMERMGKKITDIFSQLSAAFDTINYGFLLGQLAEVGVGGIVLQWLWSFLVNRSQMVVLGDSYSAPLPLRVAVSVLERCLEAVGIWKRANKLRLNLDKTEVLLVQKSMMQVLDYYPTVKGVSLPLKEQVRSLGVLLDLQLLLDVQVSAPPQGVQIASASGPGQFPPGENLSVEFFSTTDVDSSTVS
ncbi:Golgi-associated RAB2 interactor protein 1A [Tiliqua scincoides]|uniref:Golgi-associated RAB2 interactor protein 1A n=1 Tax=Tiliqua scincoides TaxID=71010 RepID=UPI00346305A6